MNIVVPDENWKSEAGRIKETAKPELSGQPAGKVKLTRFQTLVIHLVSGPLRCLGMPDPDGVVKLDMLEAQQGLMLFQEFVRKVNGNLTKEEAVFLGDTMLRLNTVVAQANTRMKEVKDAAQMPVLDQGPVGGV